MAKHHLGTLLLLLQNNVLIIYIFVKNIFVLNVRESIKTYMSVMSIP
jgi:hypothetical protein